MRICYITNSTIPAKSANSIATIKICEAFTELNNEVMLVTRNTNCKIEDIYKLYDVKSKFKIKSLKNFKKFPLKFKFYLYSLMSIISSLNFKPDLYFTRNLFTCFLLVLLRKKVIIELHNGLNAETRIVKILIKLTNYLDSKYILKIITITNGVKYDYENKKCIDTNKTFILPSGSSIKNKFNFQIKKKIFKIGYFGSLYKSRGIDLIFELSKIDKNNNYYLYGDLNQVPKSKLNNLSKNLNIKNYVPYSEIPSVLEDMDILLMPYISSITVNGDVSDITKYTSPLKLFDYLCAGKIIICSDFDVLKEIIKNKQNAIFVKNYKNPYSWKNEILKLKHQPSKQFIISKNNYLLGKKYSLKSRAKLILNSLK